MSERGPSVYTSGVASFASPSSSSTEGNARSTDDANTDQNMSLQQRFSLGTSHPPSRKHAASQTNPPSPISKAPVEMRAHFDEFAAQLRLRRHSEYKRRILEHRRTHLQKAVALSSRLRRLSSWVHDGLVEISKFPNPGDFVRVHENLINLTDACFSRWSHEIRALDSVIGGTTTTTTTAPTPVTFLSRLSSSSQDDCLDFIRNVRTNPRFLVDRFKAVSPSQLVALSTTPRYSDLSAYLNSMPGSRGRSSQKKRIQSYAKNLEEYATSFERRNPMSFLLHNCYSVNSPAEDRLRVDTWSTICSSLYVETGASFLAFFSQILWEFSTLAGWRAKDRLELLLMDILQRGAFLLEPVGDYKKSSQSIHIRHTLDGEQARNFFDNAVRELLTVLLIEDGGFPEGVLRLARAILAKLPDEESQSQLRGYIFMEWFMHHFLENALTYPENQKMLLQFHISDSARSAILHQLWQRTEARVREVFEPDFSAPPDEYIKWAAYTMNNQLYAEAAVQNPVSVESVPNSNHCISVCAPELVHVLEALSQQYSNASTHFEPFMHSSMSSFSSQFSRGSPKLDRLRRELQLQFEPGQSSPASHAVDENWVLLQIETDGRPRMPDSTSSPGVTTPSRLLRTFGAINKVQEAAVRLALEETSESASLTNLPLSHRKCLRERLVDRSRDAQSSARTIEAHFWTSAIDYLDDNYPLSSSPQSDARLLQPLIRQLVPAEHDESMSVEKHVMILEDEYQAVKQALVHAGKRIEHLKIKMWYNTSIVVSGVYENAQNITKALNYMALPPPSMSEPAYSISSGSRDRPGTSTSTTSSLFEQPRLDTMKILRASQEHGGRKKLADDQVELTKKWLDLNGVENFCIGEERIHRFCMEIKMATRKLVADSAVESPDLWSSDLWVKEKNMFESNSTYFSGPTSSTRPSSVVSETPSSAPWPRPVLGSAASSRSFDAEIANSVGRKASMAGHGSTRISREILSSDLASSFASPARSTTATSGESLWSGITPFSTRTKSQTSNSLASQAPSSVFSLSSGLHPSRSQTSASLPSRPPSIYNEIAYSKPSDPGPEKAKFLETLREGLTVLLLSDLGNPVWSLGSETDAWLDSHRQNANVAQRLARRKQMSELLPAQTVTRSQLKTASRPHNRRRTWSADGSGPASGGTHLFERSTKIELDNRSLDELDDVLKKISRQVDPNAKLQAVFEFRQLALHCLERQESNDQAKEATRRRQSLGPGVASSKLKKVGSGAQSPRRPKSDNEMRDYLRDILLVLEPKTLFRDLQYIAAFTHSDILSKTDRGQAFVQVGVAALSSKDEVCRAMVELADRIISRDGIKREASMEEAEHSLKQAREYWIIAAREGNAIAQRELASLYLVHPEISVPPTVTAPLSVSSEIFKSEMMWQASEDDHNRQALCLALHWMQLASAGGDAVAQQKLKEREGKATAS
ncbi:uncharacterized protein HMPREF1541_10178 [Cyphellophora europaea CBS 101466]|uniref:Uncharacterized protein n=1 Tax=Cyphellophora europaea (strain CBS 101466) TaxID=1220924 RepID=W2S907_CYPE1|nr:uncharacterized protein HMPREF1541_10178 [Cyphellophora europaea CBS 101466]ETN44508.1 hypothetical protein HMPREF1541_10178 [Cyphellophora europaea CBS 101466]